MAWRRQSALSNGVEAAWLRVKAVPRSCRRGLSSVMMRTSSAASSLMVRRAAGSSLVPSMRRLTRRLDWTRRLAKKLDVEVTALREDAVHCRRRGCSMMTARSAGSAGFFCVGGLKRQCGFRSSGVLMREEQALGSLPVVIAAAGQIQCNCWRRLAAVSSGVSSRAVCPPGIC